MISEHFAFIVSLAVTTSNGALAIVRAMNSKYAEGGPHLIVADTKGYSKNRKISNHRSTRRLLSNQFTKHNKKEDDPDFLSKTMLDLSTER
jgi:hypothetical protein